jgi:hypothetical protein
VELDRAYDAEAFETVEEADDSTAAPLDEERSRSEVEAPAAGGELAGPSARERAKEIAIAIAQSPAVQVVAVAAAACVAGAAAVAVSKRGSGAVVKSGVGARKPTRRQAPSAPADVIEVVASRTFLVDVHLVERR